jgi:membrane protease YdiL (CAAX protease family)
MERTFVSLIAYGIFCTDIGTCLGRHAGHAGWGDKLTPAQLQALAMQGRLYGAALIIASPPTIAVLWIAIRMARREFAEYLALNWPSRGELMRALAVAAILLVAEIVLRSGGSAEAPVYNPYFSVQGAGGLLVLLIGGCIAAPIMEEFLVRGFMFRGWSQSFIGPIGAIVLTSALWAMNHTQYDWIGRFWIFIFGLALGHFRWRSNSTWLTVMVHSTVNIFFFFTMGPYT